MPLSSHLSHLHSELVCVPFRFPIPYHKNTPTAKSQMVANQDLFIVVPFFDLTGNAISPLIRKIRVNFMFRLTTPRKFFKVIYALDTRYSVMVKEKVLRRLGGSST